MTSILLLLVTACSVGIVFSDEVFVVDRGDGRMFHAPTVPGQPLTALLYIKAYLSGVWVPGPMTYNVLDRTVMWSDTRTRTIRVGGVNGRPKQKRIAFHTEPTAMTSDRYSNRVYYITNNLLMTSEFTGLDRVVLATLPPVTGGAEYRALTADGFHGKLYWTNGTDILRCNVNGSNVISILTVKGGLKTLYFNHQDDLLYWITGAREVQSLNPTTLSSTWVGDVESLVDDPVSLVVYDGVLYWTDIGLGGVGSVNLTNPKSSNFIKRLPRKKGNFFGLSTNITDIQIFPTEAVDYCSSSPCSEQATCVNRDSTFSCMVPPVRNTTLETGDPADDNPCLAVGEEYPCDAVNGNCSYDNGSVQCFCKDGFRMAPDSVNCEDPADTNPCLAEGDAYPCDPIHGDCYYNGSVQCLCNEGFLLAPNSVDCTAVDSCEDCHNGMCEVVNGTANCTCYVGYQLITIEGHHFCEDANFTYGNQSNLQGGSNDGGNPDSIHHQSPPVAVIVGVLIGIIVLVILLVVLVMFLARRRRQRKNGATSASRNGSRGGKDRL